jgi:hypothetical protein
VLRPKSIGVAFPELADQVDSSPLRLVVPPRYGTSPQRGLAGDLLAEQLEPKPLVLRAPWATNQEPMGADLFLENGWTSLSSDPRSFDCDLSRPKRVRFGKVRRNSGEKSICVEEPERLLPHAVSDELDEVIYGWSRISGRSCHAAGCRPLGYGTRCRHNAELVCIPRAIGFLPLYRRFEIAREWDAGQTPRCLVSVRGKNDRNRVTNVSPNVKWMTLARVKWLAK